MQNPHGSLDLVDVLPALTAATKGVDLQIGGINFYRRSIGNFSNNVNASKRSVPPFVGIERRDTHEPVHAALGLQVPIRILTGHKQRHRFDTDFFALLNVHGLEFETASLNPALIHPQ